MPIFQDSLQTRMRSFISVFSICMAAPLNQSYNENLLNPFIRNVPKWLETL